MNKQYYLVVGGLRNVVFTNNPVSNPDEAQEDAFGFTHSDFKCYPVGPNKPNISAVQYVIKNGLKILNN